MPKGMGHKKYGIIWDFFPNGGPERERDHILYILWLFHYLPPDMILRSCERQSPEEKQRYPAFLLFAALPDKAQCF